MAYGKRFRQKTRRKYARNHRTCGGNPGPELFKPANAKNAFFGAGHVCAAARQRIHVQPRKMHFSGLDMYALRLGSFESDAEASALSASVRALGAAGCIIDNGDGSVSVFASAYTTEAGAESVRKRLVEQGYKAEIVPFACEPVEIEVTAEAERLDGIAEAVGFSFGIINDLNNEVINYDTAERGIEYGKAIGSELLENIRSLRSALNGVHDGRGVIDALDEYYMQLTALVTAFNSAETQNRVELSGLLKNLQIGAIEAYMNMLNAVADM